MPLARSDLYRRENGKDRDRDSDVLQCTEIEKIKEYSTIA